MTFFKSQAPNSKTQIPKSSPKCLSQTNLVVFFGIWDLVLGIWGLKEAEI